MDDLAKHLREWTEEIHTETRLQRQAIESRWRRPLRERVASGRALGPLTLRETEANGLTHFDAPSEDLAIFREYDELRLSRDEPEGIYHAATFLGATSKGLTVYLNPAESINRTASTGWSLDENFIDLSGYYLDAIDALGDTGHGRENVAPVLFDGHDATIDANTYLDATESLESSALDSYQADAVASALAASPFHLIQGPPGTGKTFTLAQLVEQLLQRDHRILVTACTHRAIHQALRKIGSLIGDRCPVVKISDPIPNDNLPFEVCGSYAKSGLAEHVGPCVVGATPFAPWTSRLKGVRFDSVVLDETSQFTLPAAAMAMLPGERWFFFGDHQQLPPVSLTHRDDPVSASVFAQLARHTRPTTLNTTYRLNSPLTTWPSEQFYGGELVSHQGNADHRLSLKQAPGRYPGLLKRDPSLVRVELPHQGERTRSLDEAELAADILADLYDAGLPPEEAGVVVPFRSQASAIRRLLRGDRFTHHPTAGETTVDTVDRFQGQEREVMIYSFAASDPDFIERLREFLFLPPRLNVAVTRAKTKVILLHSTALREHAEARATYCESSRLFLSLINAAAPVTT